VKSRRQIATIAVAALVLVGAVIGGLVWHHQASPNHFLTVTPGVLYRSGLLRSQNLEYVFDKYGIKTVVNLIDPGPKNAQQLGEEMRIAAERGVRFVDMPMVPETPPSDEQLASWLALIDDPSNHPVLVHCKHGVVRTGMMVAVYEVEYLDRENRDILEDIPMFGHDLYVPHRKPMRDFILGYTPRARAVSLGGD
jgi:protein tyrosine/serine phosphatase